VGSFSKAGHDASFRRFRAVWVVLCLLASTRVAWAAEASCLQADVELLSPQPSSADLTSAAFGSTPEGAAALVIAGRDGTLLYSLDLGESFHEPVAPNLGAHINWAQVQAPAPGIFTVYGEQVALRSSDGGVSWAEVNLPANLDGPAYWLDAQRLRLAPRKAHTGRSDDAGASWELLAHEERVGIDRAVVFSGDGELGFGVGRTGLMQTTDAGRSWQPILLSEGRQEPLFDVVLDDDEAIGFAAGAGVLYRTDDRGGTWEVVQLDERSPFVAVVVAEGGLVFAASRNGGLWTSLDAGRTFDVSVMPEGDLADIDFLDGMTGVAVGEVGSILLTRDGGDSWRQLRTGAGDTLHAIDSWTQDGEPTYLAVGSGGVQVASHDGVTWENVNLERAAPLYDLAVGTNTLLATSAGSLARTVRQAPLGRLEPISTDGGVSADIFSEVVSTPKGFFVLLDGQVYRTVDGESLKVVSLGKTDPTATHLASWEETLFVATDAGLRRSVDAGKTFREFGPSGLRATQLVATSKDSVLAAVQGDIVVEVSKTKASVRAVSEALKMGSALFAEDGTAWFGGEKATLMHALPSSRELELLVLGDGSSTSTVVALGFRSASRGAALLGDGQVFATSDGGATWVALDAPLWARGESQGLGDKGQDSDGVLLWLDSGLLVAGPGGQARRFDEELSNFKDLNTRVVSSFETGQVLPGLLLLAGAGRTVIVSRDAGLTWAPLSDDLAPETLVGIRFSDDLSGIVTTDTGRILRFDPSQDEPVYESLGRESAPAGELEARGEPQTLWLTNGDGELLFSEDQGETWESSALPPVGTPLDGFDLHGSQAIGAGRGGPRLATLEEHGQWQGPPQVSPRFALFGSEKADETLLMGTEGEAWLMARDGQVRCVEFDDDRSYRDAIPSPQGWLLVGDGGTISQLVLRPEVPTAPTTAAEGTE